MPSSSGKIRLAYLLSQYPAISHTFFLKEVLGLRGQGFEIETASINSPDRPMAQLPPREAEEAASTYYLKQASPLRMVPILVTVTFGHPAVLLRGLKAAWQLGGWDPYRKAFALFYLIEGLLLGSWMRERRLRHLHAHFGGPVSTVAMLAAQAWGFDYSLTIHGPEEFYEVETFYLARKIEQASFIFCISDYCRSQLMKYCDPAHWGKMLVLRLGVDTEEFKPVEREASRTVKIVCVGRLVPAKGQHILVRAFARLREKGLDVRLVLVGSGEDRASLEREIAAMQLTDRITLSGALNHQQAREQVASADIFALASFAEGIPVALMEAMAMGIPCVSTYVAGIPELIRDHIDGLLVPPSSVEAFADALEALARDGGLRQKLGGSARERVAASYNLATNTRLLASAFESRLR